MNRILEKYQREGHYQTYRELFGDFENLEIISEALNHIIDGEILKAQEQFERLMIIPILESDQASKFFQKFDYQQQLMK